MIHYKFVHRFYFTPRRLYQMKLKSNPFCDFCSGNTVGTFFHLVWQCPEVNRLWENISSILSVVVERTIPCSPSLLLLHDISSLKLTTNNSRLLFAGLTAAKRMIACRWKPPHVTSIKEWLSSYKDIAQLELTTARLHSAKTQNISSWSNLVKKIESLM